MSLFWVLMVKEDYFIGFLGVCVLGLYDVRGTVLKVRQTWRVCFEGEVACGYLSSLLFRIYRLLALHTPPVDAVGAHTSPHTPL